MSKPITPEEMKAWIDATWEKCQSEAWREPRQWVGLTNEEQTQVAWSCGAMSVDWLDFARAIEAKLKQKNT